MSDRPVTVRGRVYPLGEPKPRPQPMHRWPAIAQVYCAETSDGGGIALAMRLELFLRGHVLGETLYHPEPVAPAVVTDYVESRPALVLAGAPDERIRVTPVLRRDGRHVEGLGFDLRRDCERRGDVLVVCGMGQVVSFSEMCRPSRRHPDGFRCVPIGLVDPMSGRPYKDAGVVTVRPAGDRLIATWTGGLWTPPKKRDVVGRRPPRRGPIVCVLNVATSLRGRSIDELDDACREWDIDPPRTSADRVESLRSRTHAIAQVYAAQVREARGYGLDLHLGMLVSTGGIGAAIFRKAGL